MIDWDKIIYKKYSIENSKSQIKVDYK